MFARCRHRAADAPGLYLRRFLQAYEQLQAAINLGKPTHWRAPDPALPVEPETSAHTPEKSHNFSEEATHSAFTLVAQACSEDADWIEVGQLGDVLSALGVDLSAEQLGESATQLDPGAQRSHRCERVCGLDSGLRRACSERHAHFGSGSFYWQCIQSEAGSGYDAPEMKTRFISGCPS